MTVTLKDVARHAGVSPITVSRVFSGTHPVAESTRHKIVAAADALGYVPHLMARALVSQHNPMIGIVVIDLANPFFTPVIDAVQEVAHQAGYLTVINQSKFQPTLEAASLDQFRQMRLAGVLPVSVSPDLDHLQCLRATGVAVVSLARRWEAGDYVAVDHFAGGYLAGQHLCRLGHRKLACVANNHAISASQEKLAGFRAALHEYGVTLTSEQILWSSAVQVEEGVRCADAMLAQADQPTAVFVTADHQAVGFLHRLRQRGVRIPEDIAIVGHDDISYAEFLEVPLTTVALPKYELGRQAAQILLSRIQRGQGEHPAFQQILLEPQLIVRASCGGSPVQ
jgi:LacI family transcriptional regulator